MLSGKHKALQLERASSIWDIASVILSQSAGQGKVCDPRELRAITPHSLGEKSKEEAEDGQMLQGTNLQQGQIQLQKNSLAGGRDTNKTRIASLSCNYHPMFVFYYFIILFSDIILLQPLLVALYFEVHCSSRLEKTLHPLTAFAKRSWEHLPKPVCTGIVFSRTQMPENCF